MLKKGGNERGLHYNNKNINIDLQLNLLNTWTKFTVADYYQNIFLVHLDQLNPRQAEQLIKKQISLTLQKKSPYFQLQKLQKERKATIEKLQSMLNEAEQNDSQAKLTQICEQIKQLREINLIEAEHILKMHKLYNCASPQSNDKQMDYYDTMLNDLDKDNQFIKESMLNKYLRFDEGYDPFLMYQYQKNHRGNGQSLHPAVKDLFNLNISYAYRLMKTKNMILELRAGFRRLEPENMMDSPLMDQFKENQSRFSRKKVYQKDDFANINAELQNANRKYSVRIEPINIYPSTHTKSRTTIYRQKERGLRPESKSITQGNQKLRLQFAKIPTEPSSNAQRSLIDVRPLNERLKRFNKINEPSYPSRSLDLHRRLQPIQNVGYNSRKKFLPFQDQQQDYQRAKPYKYKAGVGQIYRSIKLAPLKNRPQNEDYQYRPKYPQNHLQLSQDRFQAHQKEQEAHPIQYNPMLKMVKYYNPIKKQQYQSYNSQPERSKYDYTPKNFKNSKVKQSKQVQSSQQDVGLLYEEPISKYNVKRKAKLQKKTNSDTTFPLKKQQSKPKIDQECQTIQLRKPPVKQPQQEKPKPVQKKPEPPKEQSSEQSQEQVKPQIKKKKPLNTDSDQTLQDQDIVDQRPTRQVKNKPLIRTLNKELKPDSQRRQPAKTDRKANAKESQPPAKQNNNSKKQIRMKVGKANIDQVIKLIKQSKIKQEYLNSFDLQKTLAWIKVSQTYLTQFILNDETAIVALCSPIPNIGMALKFWAPVSSQVDENVTSNLFKKYIEYVEKATTCQKILFSGKPFNDLQAGQFVMKKQNLYERIRKTPARQTDQQFKPFVYIQCSNLKFANKGKSKMLYSEEIEQFTDKNSYAAQFIAQVNNNNVPSSIKSLIKFNQSVPNFKKVNEILTDQDFDNYQISQIQINNIDLMRLYLNSPLKSTFIAQDNCFKFTGTLLHQNGKEIVVSVGLTKNNGNIYFAKNVSFPSLLESVKKSSTSRVNFTVMMFNKKLYGKMPSVEGGCYGNWQVNLTWQDQMQGRIRHNMKQNVAFGAQNFTVLIQLEKIAVLGFQVNKQDLI